MLLGGVSPAAALFSEAKILSALYLARVGTTSRVRHVRLEFRYRGVLKLGSSNSCGLASNIAKPCRISVRSGVDVSKKTGACLKETQGTSRDVEFENKTFSRRTYNDMAFVCRSYKQFGKDFSVLAELLPQQVSNSASLLEEQKRPSPKHDPVREPNQSVSSVRTMEDILNSWPSKVENKVGADFESNEMSSKRHSSQKDASQVQKVGGKKFLVERGKSRKAPVKQSTVSPVAKVQSEENSFEKTVGSVEGIQKGRRENTISQAYPSMLIQSSAETISASGRSLVETSTRVEDSTIVDKLEKPSLRGRDILLAMQKAAIEKAKRKQRNRSAFERPAKVKENAVSQEILDRRDTRPIVIRPEWALQIESLEGRIKDLKHQIQTV